MIAQTENKVRIEGILSEINITPRSFKRDNNTVNALSGIVTIRVNQPINGVDTELEIPVHVFAAEFTTKGAVNPAYESLTRVMNEYVSIAAGGLANADCVRITSAQVSMNEYYNQSGALVSFPRITASFINKIKRDECKPEATFSTTFVVGSKGYETDSDGVETDKYKITAILPQYGGKVDVIPFVALNRGVIDAVSNYWNVGDTVKATGRLNFSSKTETYTTKPDFGEPMEQTRTISISELVITGGSSTPLEGDFAISSDDVSKALAERKARLAEMKEKAMGVPQKTTTSKGFTDLGF